MEKLINIYKITNLKTNYIYVGSTSKTLEKRFKEHCKPSNINHIGYENSELYKDIAKQGAQDFKIELLDTCFERHRFIIEEYWWNKLYETEYLMYDIKKGNCHSHNTKQRIANKRNLKEKEKYSSEEFKYHVSLATSGEKNGMYGKKNDDALNGRIVVAYYDREHTKIFKEFISQKVALQFINVNGHSGMNNACRENSLYHGYYWSKEWINR